MTLRKCKKLESLKVEKIANDEEWKLGTEIGYPNLIISNYGRVWRIEKEPINETDEYIEYGPVIYEVSPYVNKRNNTKNGYYAFQYHSKITFVHRLVAMLFVDGYSDDLVVDHIDENSLNNKWTNLQWIKSKDNVSKSLKYNHENGNYDEHLRKLHNKEDK